MTKNVKFKKYVYNSDSGAIGLLISKECGAYKVRLFGVTRLWRDRNCQVYSLYVENNKVNPYLPNEIVIERKHYYKLELFVAYYISQDGCVFSLFGNRFLKTSFTKTGYRVVGLSTNGLGRTKTKSIHRLIAERFIPNPSNYREVDHIDGDRSNNAVSNLRWCTHKQNMSFPIAIQRKRLAAKESSSKGLETKRKNGSIQCKEVLECNLEGTPLHHWASVREASRMTGVPFGNISQCCIGNLKQSHGRIWKFAHRENADNTQYSGV